jgi:hypothetical protein
MDGGLNPGRDSMNTPIGGADRGANGSGTGDTDYPDHTLDRFLDLLLSSFGAILVITGIIFTFIKGYSTQASAMLTAAGLFGIGHGARRGGNANRRRK